MFRVLASPTIGAGHLMRSIALAQAAESSGIPSVFLLDNAAKAIAIKRHDWNFNILPVPSDLLPANEGRWIAGQAIELDAVAIIFDGYTFAPDLVSCSRNEHSCVVVMDDGMTSLTEIADIIVDPTANQKVSTTHQTFCSGSEYRLLRKEFAELLPKRVKDRNGIVLNLGGSDPKNLTIPLLNALASCLPDFPIRVVTGPAYPSLSELEECIAKLPNPIQHIHNCQDMAEVWNNAKLAISAAGGSQFELGICATPSVLLVIADNQKEATKIATREGWAISFDCTEKAAVSEIATCVKNLLSKDLQAMSDKAKGLYDAEGAMRLLNKIAEFEK